VDDFKSRMPMPSEQAAAESCLYLGMPSLIETFGMRPLALRANFANQICFCFFSKFTVMLLHLPQGLASS
jgi:hypothetical protein